MVTQTTWPLSSGADFSSSQEERMSNTLNVMDGWCNDTSLSNNPNKSPETLGVRNSRNWIRPSILWYQTLLESTVTNTDKTTHPSVWPCSRRTVERMDLAHDYVYRDTERLYYQDFHMRQSLGGRGSKSCDLNPVEVVSGKLPMNDDENCDDTERCSRVDLWHAIS